MFLFVHGTWAVIADKDAEGMLAFVGCLLLIVLPGSYLLLNTTFDDWYRNVFMCGIRRMGYTFTSLSRTPSANGDVRVACWEKYFVFYWGVCIKYIIPFALWYILVTLMVEDFRVPAGGYATHW